MAVRYLKKKGYKILERNFERKVSRFLKSEIDIVARPRRSVFDILRGKKDDAIHFVEVKTLIGGKDFAPEQKVNFQKKRKLAKTAETWLLKNKIPLDCQWQIDVISIRIDPQTKNPQIIHFKNAVSLTN